MQGKKNGIRDVMIWCEPSTADFIYSCKSHSEQLYNEAEWKKILTEKREREGDRVKKSRQNAKSVKAYRICDVDDFAKMLIKFIHSYMAGLFDELNKKKIIDFSVFFFFFFDLMTFMRLALIQFFITLLGKKSITRLCWINAQIRIRTYGSPFSI